MTNEDREQHGRGDEGKHGWGKKKTHTIMNII